MDCSLYFQGESYGWEVQLRDDGFFQRFIFKEAALRLAGELRRDSSATDGRRCQQLTNRKVVR